MKVILLRIFTLAALVACFIGGRISATFRAHDYPDYRNLNVNSRLTIFLSASSSVVEKISDIYINLVAENDTADDLRIPLDVFNVRPNEFFKIKDLAGNDVGLWSPIPSSKTSRGPIMIFEPGSKYSFNLSFPTSGDFDPKADTDLVVKEYILSCLNFNSNEIRFRVNTDGTILVIN